MVLMSPTAFAYLDPGTGSMIIQMAIAGILGALFTIKLYWYKLKATILKWMGKELPLNEDYEEEDVDSDNKGA